MHVDEAIRRHVVLPQQLAVETHGLVVEGSDGQLQRGLVRLVGFGIGILGFRGLTHPGSLVQSIVLDGHATEVPNAATSYYRLLLHVSPCANSQGCP